jgi:hypothetical protein
LNQPSLKERIEKEEILGNPDIRDINVSDEGEEMSLINYLEKEFIAKSDFMNFLEETLMILRKSEKDFSDKRDFWNKNGKNIFTEISLLEEYRKAILV